MCRARRGQLSRAAFHRENAPRLFEEPAAGSVSQLVLGLRRECERAISSEGLVFGFCIRFKGGFGEQRGPAAIRHVFVRMDFVLH